MAAYREIIHRLLPEDALVRDDEEASECDSRVIAVGDEHLVCLGDVLRDIRDEWVRASTKSAGLAIHRRPVVVRELAVHAHANHLLCERVCRASVDRNRLSTLAVSRSPRKTRGITCVSHITPAP